MFFARLTPITALATLLLFAASAPAADWREELAQMSLSGNPSALDETNCVPLMLQAFHGSASVKALIFMPGSTDELYFFHRVHVQLQGPKPSLSDAIVALTNQTPVRATWRAPFLILHTEEDPVNPIGAVQDTPTAERITAMKLASPIKFDDRDWGVLQPLIAKKLGLEIAPGPNSYQSHHFYRHSFAASGLSGWELLEAVAMAGKTTFSVAHGRVIFQGDTRVPAVPTVPTNFLASKMEPPSMKRIGTIPLENVHGRLDHFSADPKTAHLFVAALENHSIEVIDTKAGRRTRKITGVNEPQGVAFAPDANLLLVCSRGDGSVRSFDAKSFVEGLRIDLGSNADNIRVHDREVIVGSGAEPGPGLLSAIDLAFFTRTQADPKRAILSQVKLPAHPESFQLDPASHRIFVNVPDAHQIVVVDSSSAEWKISATWSVTAAEKNFPMVLDATNNRMFVGCRKPACILAYNTSDGRLLFQSPCVGDPDDLFYDASLNRVYMIGGEGALDVFMVPSNATDATRLTRVSTAPNARTGLFIPELQIVAVAAPMTTNQPSRILLYQAGQ